METCYVRELPKCDFCFREGKDKLASVDGATNTPNGRWANMCEYHFNRFGVGLGMGKGQRMIVDEEGR